MICDHRRRPQFFEGIILQEFDAAKGAMVGPRKNIFRGTDLALVEGPHLYKRNGYYYLLTAEGGTAYGHACTLARSKDIWGPYEVHPDKHILTSKDSPFAALQRSGHGDIVDSPDGKSTYLVHLCGRPITQERRCVLGRETSIQECEWRDDDWLYVKNGPVPSLHVEVPGTRDEEAYWVEKRYTFSSPSPSAISSSAESSTASKDRDTAADSLHADFQWLRTPYPNRILSLSDTPGALTLYGRESPGSWFEQSLVARRQTHFSYDASAVLSPGYFPDDIRQFAGLTAYYCRFNFFYLAVSGTNDDFWDESLDIGSRGQRELLIMQSEGSYPHSKLARPMVEPVPLPSRDEFDGRIKLSLEIRADKLQFFYALEDLSSSSSSAAGKAPVKWGEQKKIGPVLDASILSDECGGHLAHGSFTGAFVGMAASDINGTALPARFEEFVYTPVKHQSDRYEI
ncbi:glycosyl hydrolases family 43-domain-containing protein [Microdochium trichocladiopsis]|uniref:Glycosyl hydrolases family 43-domain-containing protein n=1 Tax=Microdochium trichocladiopsis TaxID=1682393 RepID=A0A9P8YGP6_9PEZI|nr:glycosyl hydrolases family 43-domain-containing protein [Microdochium trichocladiopsis]KAH7039653.1 glycosyl hydrolases family 43-domain-containing protein [Microdochium trichocladiopsis]